MPMTAERPGIAALRIGLRSARANVVPMIVLWALAAGKRCLPSRKTPFT